MYCDTVSDTDVSLCLMHAYSSTKMAITGVMAELGAKADSASEAPAIVVLRADMDALPIHEETDLEYKSEIDGVMHACTYLVH